MVFLLKKKIKLKDISKFKFISSNLKFYNYVLRYQLYLRNLYFSFFKLYKNRVIVKVFNGFLINIKLILFLIILLNLKICFYLRRKGINQLKSFSEFEVLALGKFMLNKVYRTRGLLLKVLKSKFFLLKRRFMIFFKFLKLSYYTFTNNQEKFVEVLNYNFVLYDLNFDLRSIYWLNFGYSNFFDFSGYKEHLKYDGVFDDFSYIVSGECNVVFENGLLMIRNYITIYQLLSIRRNALNNTIYTSFDFTVENVDDFFSAHALFDCSYDEIKLDFFFYNIDYVYDVLDWLDINDRLLKLQLRWRIKSINIWYYYFFFCDFAALPFSTEEKLNNCYKIFMKFNKNKYFYLLNTFIDYNFIDMEKGVELLKYDKFSPRYADKYSKMYKFGIKLFEYYYKDSYVRLYEYFKTYILK